MAKNLVIVESPAKGKTIEKFLGPDYQVVASMGHIRDLPKKNIGIDIDNGFSPTYEISEEKKKTVDNLKKLAKTANEVWIATDEDREGEAIGWHLCYALNLDPTKTKRIAFHEITKQAITEAIQNPRTINIDLVDAQQARRLLDRLVGYKVSPVLWSKIRKGLSAGRVQSVAVKLIVEKEREIQNFEAKESWKISSILHFKGDNKKEYNFKTTLNKIDGKAKTFKTREEVEKVLSTIVEDITKIKEGKNKKENIILSLDSKLKFKLIDLVKKDSKRTPYAPFTTSTLQQDASRKHGFSVKQTMSVAQKLYEGIDLGNGERQGLITYMRTDSLNLSNQARSQAKKLIEKEYGKNYHKERVYKTKSAGAQEAHEAIRPTDLSRRPESLKGVLDANQLRLYTLIWKRTLASQMSDAVVEVTTFTFNPESNPKQEWISKGEVVKFDGFMTLYIEGKDDDNNEEENEDSGVLPDINIGEVLVGDKIEAIQSFSNPPARYTEASLVKKLESEGIGRPSTYAPTISTIMDRGYVEKFNKKYLIPTEIAFIVNDFLEEYFTELMDYKFTSKVEEEFDSIASGEENFQTMLTKFWEGTLKKELENAGENAKKIVEKTGKACPKCGKDLVYKFSKAGKFIGCSGYPECDFTDQLDEIKDELAVLREKYEGKPCPEGGTIVVKTGRYGPFLASSEYPKVKWIGKIQNEEEEILDQILEEKGLLVDEETGEELVVKNSRRGKFLAAKNYPKVKIAKPIPKDVLEELKKRMS